MAEILIQSSSPTESTSYHLEEIADLLENQGVVVARRKLEAELGVKDFGLTAGLAVAALAVSVVGAVFDAVRFFREQNPNYSVTAKVGETTFTIDNMSSDDFVALVDQAAEMPVFEIDGR